MLTGIRAAVPVLVEGYQSAGRQLILQEETVRREFIDDLLRGDADVADIVERAEPFGIDLTAWHQVVLAGPRNDARLATATAPSSSARSSGGTATATWW